MTGTSRALRRLGVAGLGAVLATVGLVPLTTVAANAATPATTATSVTLSPSSDTAAVGQCNPFTATVSPNGSSFTVNIQQTTSDSVTQTIGFCNPTTSAEGNAANLSVGPGPNAATTQLGGGGCQNTGTTSATITCSATFTDSLPAGGDGKVIFGVTSTATGTMSVNAFGDINGNGAQDIGESGQTSTKTWVANSSTSNTNLVSCTPTSATNPAGSTHTFKCTVTDANGNPLAGQTVHYDVQSGPDAAINNNTCGPTASGAGGTNPGETTCSYLNNGTPGHDVIYVWLETNGISGPQQGEPNTTITKDWVLAAPSTSLVSVTCDAANTGTTGATNNKSVTCQQPTSDTTTVFTATVVNGSPAQPVSGVIVQWTGPVQSGSADASTDTESLSATSCTTNAQGQCSVTLTDTLPTESETQTVTATVQTQGGGSTQATGAVTYHNAGPTEARNITVTPDTASQPSGGTQTLTAAVVDRFGGPVQGVTVTWSETGPGAFRNGSSSTTCVTDATGKCSVDVSSLPTETGAQTITATINPTNSTTAECTSTAGNSKFTGTTSPGAVAGTCSDTSTVNWGAAPPSGAPTITFSQPNKTAGQTVTFSGTAPAGSTVTLTWANATTGGAFQPLATVTANSSGQWTYSTAVSYNTTVKASNSSGSNQVSVHVNVKVTITDIRFLGKDARGKCVTRFLGGTFPFIPGAAAWIRNSAVSPTQPIGFTRVFQFGSSGRYDARFGLTCGQTYRLFSLISGTGSNGVHYTDNGVGKDITYKAGTTIATGQ